MSESESSDQPAILIVGPSWVGDMVMAQPLFTLLKQRMPHTHIDVLAPDWTLALLSRMPEVRRSLTLPFGHGELRLKERYRLGQSLKGQYKQAIVLPNSLKSALIPWAAEIPKRTGWRGEMRYGLLNDIRLLSKRRYPLMVERFLALGLPPGADLVKPYPVPNLRADQSRLPTLLQQFGLSRQQPILALCPGAEFGPSKQWPARHYASVAQQKIAAGWQIWLFGSAKDAGINEQIMSMIGDNSRGDITGCSGTSDTESGLVINLAGKTDLSQAIDLLSLASAVVSNDSGLMHIAAALNRPLVAVYGSTSPEFTPPLNQNAARVSIPVECGPCFKRECPKKHLKCLNDLQPQQVIEALDNVLPVEAPIALQPHSINTDQ